jgi:hypothetical protein
MAALERLVLSHRALWFLFFTRFHSERLKIMVTLIVTTTAFIVLCGLSWHDQPAREHPKAKPYGTQSQANE